MRFTKAREEEVLAALAETPDMHLVFPAAVYRPDGNILIHRDGMAQFLHRYLYVKTIGPLPRGKFLLRGCTVDGCQNPNPPHRHTADDPLNRTSKAVRKLLGTPTAAQLNAAKTHCPQNHEYTPENTYVWIDPKGIRHRKCRKCQLTKTRARHRRNRTTSPETKGSTE